MSWAESMLRHNYKKRVNDLTDALIDGKHITNGTDTYKYEDGLIYVEREGSWWATDFNIVILLKWWNKFEVVE